MSDLYRLKVLLLIFFLLVFISGCSNASNPAPVGIPIPAAGNEFSDNIPLLQRIDPAAHGKPYVKPSQPETAAVIFTFDDGPESDYVLAYPILKKYNIKGTSYLITGLMDNNAPGKLTWAQVKEMSGYGWVFGCHTYEHKRLVSMTDDKIKRSMELVNQSFVNQELPPPEIMAYPYGSFNQRVINDIRPYRKQARLAYYQTKFVDTVKKDPYKIPSISADMRTAAQLKKVEKIVDKACKEKAVVVFRVHTLYKQKPYDTVKLYRAILSGCAPQTDSKLFEELIVYCINKGCTFMTMTQLMDIYS